MIVTITRRQLRNVNVCEASMDFFDQIAIRPGHGSYDDYVTIDTSDKLLMFWFYSVFYDWAVFAVRHELLPCLTLRNQTVRGLECCNLRAEHAQLVESLFEDCAIKIANFKSARWDRVEIRDSQMNEMFMPHGDILFSKIARCSWRQSDLSDSSVYQSNIIHTDMRNLRFADTLFWGVWFDTVDLSHAYGQKVCFRNCTFKDVKLVEVDLRTARFENCVFYGGTDLTNTQIDPDSMPYVAGWRATKAGVMVRREPALTSNPSDISI